MKARIETVTEKKIIGKSIPMSFVENKTFQLWSSFMPVRKEIRSSIDSNLYSLEVFPVGYFDNFNPGKTFQKWAGVEVSDFNEIPADMETLIIPTGKYAVFIHKGAAAKANETYQAIFTQWLPNSEYKVDERPHFAVMSEKYKKDDPDSEEEIWIPIQIKA